MKADRNWPRIRCTALLAISLARLIPAAPAQTIHDSVRSTAVAAGILHWSYTRTGPFTLDVLEVDLSNPDYMIESYRPKGLVRTSVQMQENDRNGHRVIAAINADFFSFKTGWPVGNQVVNGQFVLGTQTSRSHFVLSTSGRPLVERLRFVGWLQTKAGARYDIHGVNDTHRNNAIIFHTSYSDTATSFGGAGMKFLLKLVGSDWAAGDTLRLWVQSATIEESKTVGSAEAVLWIGGGQTVWPARADVQVGDTLLVYLGFEPNLRRVANVVGGAGMILLDGRPVSDSTNVEERISVAFLKSRHPRTFVAFDRDTTKLFLCTVDGRQESSVGMSFQEMAEFLASIGAWTAINLDGGGSTTMVVNGSIVNSPSDKTGERPVANTLQVVSRKSCAPMREQP